MATTTCISANPVKKRGNTATIVQANSASTNTKLTNVAVSTLARNNKTIRTYQAVSAVDSGHLGTIRPYTAGTFGYFARGQYIGPIIGRYVSGVASTIFMGGANRVNQRPRNPIRTRKTAFLYSMTWTANRAGQPTYSTTVNTQNLDFNADYGYVNTTGVGIFVERTGKPVPVHGTYPQVYSM